LFLAIVVCLAIWQVWLTWRLMEQDRNLAEQRSRERLEQIAGLSVAQLSNTIAEWELKLRDLDALPPAAAMRAAFPGDGTFVLLTRQSVSLYPPRPLLFVPEHPAGAPLPRVFDAAEDLEFREQNYPLAIQALQPLTAKPATRAEALLRIARLERKLNHREAALAAYERMSSETAVSPDGVPYALLALGARCELLPRKSVRQLRVALVEGRWPLDHDTFDYYWAEVNRLEPSSDRPPRDALEFSSLAGRLHEQWQLAMGAGSRFSGREMEPDATLLNLARNAVAAYSFLRALRLARRKHEAARHCRGHPVAIGGAWFAVRPRAAGPTFFSRGPDTGQN
jgi:hypothetical protein